MTYGYKSNPSSESLESHNLSAIVGIKALVVTDHQNKHTNNAKA